MTDLKSQKLAALVLMQPAVAEIFEKHSLDFCCRGKRTLEDACMQQALDLNAIVAELESALNKSGGSKLDFSQLSPADLANYIKAAHHSYVSQKTPLLSAHTAKVAMRHGDRHPELKDISEKWQKVSEDLMQHMMKEEHVLFPYIEKLQRIHQSSAHVELPQGAFVANPIRVMEAEHEVAGDVMAQIRQLAADYNPPEEACTTWRLMLSELKEFEEDLHRHVHLENFLLFPKAIEMEKEVIQKLQVSQN